MLLTIHAVTNAAVAHARQAVPTTHSSIGVECAAGAAAYDGAMQPVAQRDGEPACGTAQSGTGQQYGQQQLTRLGNSSVSSSRVRNSSAG